MKCAQFVYVCWGCVVQVDWLLMKFVAMDVLMCVVYMKNVILLVVSNWK
jgi:hypothetical protein